MIVTLAGHVDHGKTTLVRLLTGTDTDRLAEEKRRGLTIDLGFAYLRNGEATVGFVDGPGHHRFIHNMVAGVASMQHALLVVAADDGPMPQSREHLQILDLLGVSTGVVALSKCDGVPAGRIEEARGELENLLTGTFLERAPVIETAASTGAGIDALRSHLLARAAEVEPADLGRPFRMPVDRAFILKGTGLVVTGTVHGGRVHADDEVHVFPAGDRGRARGLRVQDRQAASACTGDRTAVDLAGVHGRVKRGYWLCARPETGHRSLVVDLKVLEDFPRDIRHWSPVHVYHATSHATARLALLQGARLQAGARAWVELILDEPLLGKRGDRVVVRDQALERTLGGGRVLDNRPADGRRRSPARLRSLEACALPTPQAALAGLLNQGPVQINGFQGAWDLADDHLDELLGNLPATRQNGWLIDQRLWRQWLDMLLAECRRRHGEDRALQGLRENDFEAAVPPEFRARVLGELVAAGELVRRAGRFRPHAHEVALAPAERDLLDRLGPLLDEPQPPSLGDLSRTLRIPFEELRAGVQTLSSKGLVVQVTDKRVYLPAHLNELARKAEELSRQGPFTVRQYRDAAAIGRNVAIDVLEYFDARGFTRRLGETRSVVGDRSKLPGSLR